MKKPSDSMKETSHLSISENHRIIAAHLTAANKYMTESIILEKFAKGMDD